MTDCLSLFDFQRCIGLEGEVLALHRRGIYEIIPSLRGRVEQVDSVRKFYWRHPEHDTTILAYMLNTNFFLIV